MTTFNININDINKLAGHVTEFSRCSYLNVIVRAIEELKFRCPYPF
jgi:hypothetical protein